MKNKDISSFDKTILVDGKDFPIPEKGSLGLLALGYTGLVAWREKRKWVLKEKNNDGKKAGK